MDDCVNSLRDIIPKPIHKKYHFSFKAEILQGKVLQILCVEYSSLTLQLARKLLP